MWIALGCVYLVVCIILLRYNVIYDGMKKDTQADKKHFIDLAIKLGADHAVVFRINDIVFDTRTILKCMFGCGDWGKGNTCPSRPGSLKPWEYQKVFQSTAVRLFDLGNVVTI